MKHYTILIALLAALLLPACHHKADNGESTALADTTALMMMNIRKCSRLYTQQITVNKIVTYQDSKQLFNFTLPFSERKIAIPIEATVKAYIDFGDFNRSNIRRKGDKIEIILPDPQLQLTATRIRHNEIRRQDALLQHNFTDAEISQIEQNGRKAILADLDKLDVVTQSELAAARVIEPILEQLGYKEENITISFRHDITNGSVSRLNFTEQTNKEE